MNRIKKYTLRLCLSLAVCFLYSFFFSTQISALIINGTGSSGGGSHTVTASGGYAVSLTDAGNAPAYRFTVIDNTGYFKTQSYDIMMPF